MNDPFLLLPANLAGLARVASSIPSYLALSGIYAEVTTDGYEVAATNGRSLVVVSGKPAGDPLSFPAAPELAELPASEGSGVIPRDLWQETFRQAAKCKDDTPGAGQVAVHLGQVNSVLAFTDGAEVHVEQVGNVDGKYPPYRNVLPKKEPAVRIEVNAEYLLEMVKLAMTFGPGRETGHRITLEVHAANEPMVIRAGNGEQRMTGLLMPMT